MQRLQASRRPDQRLVLLTAAVLIALLANLFWAPTSGASDEDLEPPVDVDIWADLDIRVGNMGKNCSGTTFAVVLENTASAPLDVVVSVDGADTAVRIDGFATKRVFTEATEDTSYSIVVTTPSGDVLFEETVFRNCIPDPVDPNVSVADSCAEGGAVVTITAEPSTEQTVNVIVNDTIFETVTVPAGETVTVLVPLAEDETATIAVTDAEGMTLADETITHDCVVAGPIITFDVSCDTGAVVRVQNPADVEQTVQIREGVDLLAIVAVPAGATLEQPLHLVEDQPTTLQVVLAGEVIAEDTLTLNCVSDEPTVVASLDCLSNQLIVQITNVTPNPITATIAVGNPMAGDPIVQDVDLDGRQTVTQTLVVDEGSTNVVSVSVGGEIVFQETITDDCSAPPEPAPILSASLTHDCTSSVATIALNNTGNADGVFTVNVNGTVTVIPVAAGLLQLHTFTVTEDASYQVSVSSADGTVLLTSSFVYNCVPDVVVKPKIELPRTGTNGVYTTVLSGLLLLCLGMIAVDVSRKETPII
ncbi:MAG: hypothetical protein HKN26_00180 [Acidimicrobiales bacterium]|nr:hypothetical protein [Acidimicrobiales bacterium]